MQTPGKRWTTRFLLTIRVSWCSADFSLSGHPPFLSPWATSNHFSTLLDPSLSANLMHALLSSYRGIVDICRACYFLRNFFFVFFCFISDFGLTNESQSKVSLSQWNFLTFVWLFSDFSLTFPWLSIDCVTDFLLTFVWLFSDFCNDFSLTFLWLFPDF